MPVKMEYETEGLTKFTIEAMTETKSKIAIRAAIRYSIPQLKVSCSEIIRIGHSKRYH